MSKLIKRIAVEILVILAKLLSLLKQLVVSLGSLFVLKPGKSVLRLVFYKIVVKAYTAYYSTAKKLGWKGREAHGFRLSKELSHIFIIGSVIAVISLNLITNSRAEAASPIVEKNILASLVTAEFGGQDEAQLIEETAENSQLVQFVNPKAMDNPANIKAQPRATKVLVDDTEVDSFAADSSGDETDLAFIRPGSTVNDTRVARHDVIDYVVQNGDTISTIAEKMGIGVSTILWENNLNANSLIRPGDNLRILPVSGVTHQVAKGETIQSLAAHFSITEKDIISANDLSVGQSLAVGSKLIIPGGKKEQFASFKPKAYSGVSVVRDIVEPVKKLVKNLPKAPSISNKMTWPTVGYRITQYFSWRHFAIDVANHVGTPLYAADAGVIESAGWGKGYGNNIVINHGGGKKTRYAHMSKFYVSKGDVVEKGQQIGEMGNTGWSTGPHIHFEVMINGTKYNPLNYVR